MFKIFQKFVSRVSIDLGTANILIGTAQRGLIIDSPAIVAVNTKTDEIIALGEEAKEMLGRTPPHINVSRPLENSIIADFEVTEKMLRYFFDKLNADKALSYRQLKAVVGVPIGITEVERKAVEDAVVSAGAKNIYLVENPLAAALGAQLMIGEPKGNMVVDIGCGSTQIAVISLEGIVNSKRIEIAGKRFDQTIIQKVREDYNVLLGETIAEEAKIKIGAAISQEKEMRLKIRGRDLISGLPQEVVVDNELIRRALEKPLNIIVEEIKSVLETTPPELAADIYEKGIVLTGGGALLRGIDQLISQKVNIPVSVADEPLTVVFRGLNFLHGDDKVLKNISSLIDTGPIIK